MCTATEERMAGGGGRPRRHPSLAVRHGGDAVRCDVTEAASSVARRPLHGGLADGSTAQDGSHSRGAGDGLAAPPAGKRVVVRTAHRLAGRQPADSSALLSPGPRSTEGCLPPGRASQPPQPPPRARQDLAAPPLVPTRPLLSTPRQALPTRAQRSVRRHMCRTVHGRLMPDAAPWRSPCAHRVSAGLAVSPGPRSASHQPLFLRLPARHPHARGSSLHQPLPPRNRRREETPPWLAGVPRVYVDFRSLSGPSVRPSARPHLPILQRRPGKESRRQSAQQRPASESTFPRTSGCSYPPPSALRATLQLPSPVRRSPPPPPPPSPTELHIHERNARTHTRTHATQHCSRPGRDGFEWHARRPSIPAGSLSPLALAPTALHIAIRPMRTSPRMQRERQTATESEQPGARGPVRPAPSAGPARKKGGASSWSFLEAVTTNDAQSICR